MSNDIEKARKAKAAKAAERKRTLTEVVQAILADPMTNDELKRKLQYCQTEIAKGRDGGLVKVRGTLVTEATRKRSY